MKTCQSCGRLMREPSDFAGSNTDSPYCSRCADEFGFLRGYSDVVTGMRDMLEDQLAYAPGEARRIAEQNIRDIPAWMKREKMMHETDHVLITDIGSTTTKAVLLRREGDKLALVDLFHSPTTVEKPEEDVRIGIRRAVRGLEQKTGVTLLQSDDLRLAPGVLYLSTSSAGGGLQILVVGLTVADSASSARRAAYGAGGVLLDTFAIDDKRSAVQQMLAMQALRPDIILFSGGVDGGAVTGLMRMAEILSLADPRPKFGAESIPLVYAGNTAAAELVRSVLEDVFDLHMVANLRPTMTDENLDPARQTIHRLFMDNVMEQAPAYGEVKKVVSDDIIPTPMGVIKSLQLLSRSLEQNIMAVDIGGATTDVFSNILGHYYRTVSANLGMSYSLCNVLAEAGWSAVARWLPPALDEDTVRDYIGNKMLCPEHNPTEPWQTVVEQACAREAIRLARAQHMEMHFNTAQIGFLDRLKTQDNDKFVETMYVEKKQEERRFREDSIDLLIGAGGVVSAATPTEATLMLTDALQPRGVTELWRDRLFLSPHLGKLSDMDEQAALALLTGGTYQRLAVVIRPLWRKARAGQPALEVELTNGTGSSRLSVKADELHWLPATGGERHIAWKTARGFWLPEDGHVNTDLPVLIDTRLAPGSCGEQAWRLLGWDGLAAPQPAPFRRGAAPETDDHTLRLALPYPGDILVKPGDTVQPDTLVGENRYDPPRIFILPLTGADGPVLDAEGLRSHLLVQVGEEIRSGQKLLEVKDHSLLDALAGRSPTYHSPIRGRVETINYDAGLLVAREIQDYSTKPVEVNVAAQLGVEPKDIKGYMKRHVGDFVYSGEMLATRMLEKGVNPANMFCNAPSTGTITEVNTKTGKAVIRYDREPFRLYSGVKGRVRTVQDNRAVVIDYDGDLLNGVLGFGGHGWGPLVVISEPQLPAGSDCRGAVLACTAPVDAAFLRAAAAAGVHGIVAPSMQQKQAVDFLDAEIGVALTGNEAIAYPLVLTEGFGCLAMREETAARLRSHAGKLCYLQAATQIRAGVQRPHIILFS